MSQVLHDNDDANDNAKAIAIPRIFLENSRAKKVENSIKLTSSYQSMLNERGSDCVRSPFDIEKPVQH